MMSYYHLTVTRRLLMLAAWLMVLCAMFFIPSVHTHVLAFASGEADYGGWLVLLSNTLGLLLDMANESIFAEDSTKTLSQNT